MSEKKAQMYFTDPISNRTINKRIVSRIVQTTIPAQIHEVSWNDNIEQSIQEIGEKSKGYKIMHIQESRKISQYYKHLMYAGITLGPLAGLISAIGAIIDTSNTTSPVELPITSTCIAFISGLVVAITKYGKFEEKSSHHKQAASKYTSLESNVRRQLVLPKTERVDAVKYLEYVGSSFDDLFSTSPLVSKQIYEQYVTIAKQNGIVVPDEYGLTVNIDKSFQHRKFNEMKNTSAININNSSVSSTQEVTPKSVALQINDSPESKNKSVSPETLRRHRDSIDATEIKRSGTFTHFPDLNKFSDGRMEYEMERLMGLK